jgi:integrase
MVDEETKLVQVPGGWEGRFRCGGLRKRAVITVKHEHEARSRDRRIRQVLLAIGKANKGDKAKQAARCVDFLEQAATAPSAAVFNGICRAAADLAANPDKFASGPLTFRDVADLWLTGVLHQRYPGAFRKQSATTASNTKKTLEKHVMRHVGDLAVRSFTMKHFEAIMMGLPKELTATNKIARSVDVVLRGAVELELIAHNPIKRSAIPPARDPHSVMFTYLYPHEEEALIRCAAIPLERRAFYGFMTRNGTRPHEAEQLAWGDVDLENGTVNLDITKTESPRFWMMDSDVIAMLVRLKPEGALPTDLVFSHLAASDRASQLRRDLKTAGCTRATLGIGRKNPFKGKPRRRIRCHDLRATFVTVALASGWTEAQVKERSGHETDVMLARYKRRATNALELGHGNWFAPLDECLWPESRPSRGPQVGQRLGQIISIQRKKAASGSSSTTTEGVQEHAGTRKPAVKRPPAGPSLRVGPPPRGGVGQTVLGQVPGPEHDLTLAIANATAAGKWKLAERLTVQLEGLIAAGLPKPR